MSKPLAEIQTFENYVRLTGTTGEQEYGDEVVGQTTVVLNRLALPSGVERDGHFTLDIGALATFALINDISALHVLPNTDDEPRYVPDLSKGRLGTKVDIRSKWFEMTRDGDTRAAALYFNARTASEYALDHFGEEYSSPLAWQSRLNLGISRALLKMPERKFGHRYNFAKRFSGTSFVGYYQELPADLADRLMKAVAEVGEEPSIDEVYGPPHAEERLG